MEASIGIYEVIKTAKIRNRYNQVPHLTQDTNGKVTTYNATPQTRAKRPFCFFLLLFFSNCYNSLILPTDFYRVCNTLHNLIRACIFDHMLVMLMSPLNLIWP